MTDFIVIIPARLNSTRLPGKALADINGKPMVQHVYEQACRSQATRVIVATDHPDIFKAIESIGGNALMTSSTHVSGTDRLAECVNLLALDDDEIIVNVQGDEPLIPPEIINQVARNLARRPAAGMATLCEPILDTVSLFNPNIVKVVFTESGMAMYFSRAPIPWDRSTLNFTSDRSGPLPTSIKAFRHIGLYAYRAGLLRDFSTWPASPIEQTEALEQLRALWNDVKIHVDTAEVTPEGGVDTPEDLDRVRAHFARNKESLNKE